MYRQPRPGTVLAPLVAGRLEVRRSLMEALFSTEYGAFFGAKSGITPLLSPLPLLQPRRIRRHNTTYVSIAPLAQRRCGLA